MNVRAKVAAPDEAPEEQHMPASAEAPQKDNVAPLVPKPMPEAEESTPKRRRRSKRLYLIVALPLVVLVGGSYVWLTGGRYVETDNAYVQQTDVSISADVAGKITDVMVDENQRVKAGDVLFTIDDEPFRIALNAADAALAQARLEVQQLRADYRTAVAKLKAAESTAEVRKRAFDRSRDLAKKGYATPADLDQAQLAATQADNDVALAKQEVDSATAALDGNPGLPTDQHPSVLAALANKAKAALDLKHTTVRAPADGIVSQVDKLNEGQYVTAGTAMASIVEAGDAWVQANFKETQLTHMRPGQVVEVGIDTYPDLKLEGTVGSIGAATGSQFSLIPAQNATGNWVKVVQRIPVRIKVKSTDGPQILRSGMSASISVDTGKTRLDRMF